MESFKLGLYFLVLFWICYILIAYLNDTRERKRSIVISDLSNNNSMIHFANVSLNTNMRLNNDNTILKYLSNSLNPNKIKIMYIYIYIYIYII